MGSPPPKFYTDSERASFHTILKIHPEFEHIDTLQGAQDQIDLPEIGYSILNLLQEKPLSMAEILGKLAYKSRNHNVRIAVS